MFGLLGPDVDGTHAAQLLEGAKLDLPHALAGDLEPLADFFERVRVAVIEAEAHPHHVPLTRGQLVQNGVELFAANQVHGGVGRRLVGIALDEVRELG